MAVLTITAENFEEEVTKSEVLVLLDFWADWCGPCKMAAPIVEELAGELSGKVKVGKVNVDEEASLALKYDVMSIPTFMVMKNGKPAGKAVGVQTKQALTEMLEKNEG